MKKLLVIPALFFIGCSSKNVTLNQYSIKSYEHTYINSSKYKNKTIKVMYPKFLSNIDSTKIKYSYSSIEEGFYENSEWSSDLGDMIQSVLIKSLSNLFKGVFLNSSIVNSDYILETTVYDFSHHVRGNESYSIVSIQASLIDKHTGRLIKSKKFYHKEFTDTTNAVGYIKSVNNNYQKITIKIIDWLVK